jgi:hypothetical protein
VLLKWLEEEVSQTAYTNRSDYEHSGGFTGMALSIAELVAEGYLKPVESSPRSYKPPFIHTAYWLTESAPALAGWDRSSMLRLRELLDLHYYDIHPETQSVQAWNRVERLYTFLRTASCCS